MFEVVSSLKKAITNKKVPVKIQMNQYDCGPSCLHMLLGFHGYEADFASLRNRFAAIASTRDGYSMLQIKKVAEDYKLKVQAKRCDARAFDKKMLPAILFWEEKHFVVLEKFKSDKKFIIIDPALGRIELDYKEFTQKYSGVLLYCQPGKDFVQTKEKKHSKFSFFSKLVLENRRFFFLAVIFAFCLQIVSISFPFIIQFSVDSLIQGDVSSIIPYLVTAVLTLVIFHFLFSYIKDICIVKLQQQLDSQLTNSFITHMLDLPYQYFEGRSRGDLMLRINSNVTIREILSQKFVSTIINIFLVTVTFAVVLVQSTLIAVTLLGLGFVQVSVLLYTRRKFKKLTQTQIAAQSLAGSFMTEVLEGISTVKSLGIEKETDYKWKDLFDQQLKAVKTTGFYQAKISTITNGINFATPIVILLVSLYQLQQGEITVGMLMAFISLASLFLGPLNSLAMMIVDFAMVDSLLDRIYDVLKEKTSAEEDRHFNSDFNDDCESQGDLKLEGEILINNVNFKYSNFGEDILTNINILVNPGERVAIVGRSGSGKSTLANLLVGLYKPTEGQIFFDGNEINEIKRKSLRSQISIVLQDNFVFNRTIYENITIHAPNASVEDVKWAASIVDVDSDIEKMPMGYNTLISESGTNLSGGQKQRIALARALVNRPKILLLDEATSSLDSVTESNITKNLHSLNCTQIIVAHRLSTIINTDKIYVIDNGEIVERGTHTQLIANSKFYEELVSAQMNSKEVLL